MPSTQTTGKLGEWLDRVETLVQSIQKWSQSEGWAVHAGVKIIKERDLGEYEAPYLRVALPEGELHVKPVALDIVGADGRVDLEGFPSLNRVRLVGGTNGWRVITDSNIPLRQPWGRKTFVQLARDLTAAP